MGAPNTYLQLLNAKKLIAQLQHDIEHMKGFPFGRLWTWR